MTTIFDMELSEADMIGGTSQTNNPDSIDYDDLDCDNDIEVSSNCIHCFLFLKINFSSFFNRSIILNNKQLKNL